MKKCRFCNSVLYQRDNEDNWAFNQRVYCNHICYSKNKTNIVHAPYKTRCDKGRTRERYNYNVENMASKTKQLWDNPEYRTRMQDAHKGHRQSAETIEKRVSQFRGERHHNWKGGITPVNEKIRKSGIYKKWRISVFDRDKYTCVNCGKRGGILHAHHIYPFALYVDLRLDIDNGITLCKICHQNTNTYGNKSYNYEKTIEQTSI